MPISSLISLLFQSFCMGFASLLCGLIPLMSPALASGKRLKMASTFGMGLLVGAAMVVIIPEGISTIYASTVILPSSHNSSSVVTHPHTALATVNVLRRSSLLPPPAAILSTPVSPRDDDDRDDDDDDDEHDHDHHSDGKIYGSDPTEAIGLSLLCGFVLMMLIEQFAHSHSNEPSLPAPTSPTAPNSPSHLNAPSAASSSAAALLSPSLTTDPVASEQPPTWHSLSRRPSEGPAPGSDDGINPEEERGEDATLLGRAANKAGEPTRAGGGGGGGARDHSKSFSATLGLVIHSAADGIALGASARSGKSGLGLVIFLAIFVHKIPASLGLCTTLMSDSLPRHLVRQRVALFSAAAPIGAIVTYFLVHLLAGGIEQSLLMWWTGVALIFSGGTFLYVIATVLQDLNPSKAELAEDGALSKRLRMGLVLGGMIAPLVLTRLGGHHH